MPGGASILIVEDDINVREEIGDVLAEEGHTLSVARNGVEALATLEFLPRPSLILLDIWMPVMDGLTFLRKLQEREDRSDFEVVVMSAVVGPDWFVDAPGVTRALKKPFVVSDIISVSAEFAARRSWLRPAPL
jgi:CheY-like chemotaxis protein